MKKLNLLKSLNVTDKICGDLIDHKKENQELILDFLFLWSQRRILPDILENNDRTRVCYDISFSYPRRNEKLEEKRKRLINWTIEINHVVREVNYCADILARTGHQFTMNIQDFDIPLRAWQLLSHRTDWD